MACKFNTYKSIYKGVPNILFTAAYLLFSAELCTSSPKDKPRNGTGNRSLAIDQVKQIYKIEAISDLEGEANDLSQLDEVRDDLTIDSIEDDESFDSDSGTTIGLVKPLEQSVVQDKVKSSPESSEQSVVQNDTKASSVATTSSVQQQDDSNGVIHLPGASDENTHAPLADNSQSSSNRVGGANTQDASPPSEISQSNPDNKELDEKLSDKDILSILNDNTKDRHKETMSQIMKFLCQSRMYSDKVKSVALEKFLVAPAGMYSDDKVILLHNFFDQKFNNLRITYDDSILDLAIKQVTGPDKSLYEIATVMKAKLLYRNIRSSSSDSSDEDSQSGTEADNEWDD